MFSLDALFCDVDDFCQSFEPQWKTRLLHHGGVKRIRAKSLCLSEIMTILIAFHQNHYRNFKHFYLDYVKSHWNSAFPKLPSYQRFVEWTPSTLVPLCVYLKHCFGSSTGIGYVSQKLANQLLEDFGIQFFAKPRRTPDTCSTCQSRCIVATLDCFICADNY